MFEKALRNKYRFSSSKGELNLEQLWETPLRSRNKFNLNEIAKAVDSELKANSEQSFVPTTSESVFQRELKEKLEIVKHVIDVKLKEEEEALRRKEVKEEREKLMQLLHEKKENALSELTEEQIQEKLRALG